MHARWEAIHASVPYFCPLYALYYRDVDRVYYMNPLCGAHVAPADLTLLPRGSADFEVDRFIWHPQYEHSIRAGARAMRHRRIGSSVSCAAYRREAFTSWAVDC